MRSKICYFYALRAPAWFSATWSGLSAPFQEPGPRRGGPCSCPRPASCTAPLSPAHLRMYSDPHPARAVAGSWAGGGGGQGEPWPPSVQCWRERSEPSRVCPGAGDSRSEMSDVRRVWHPAAPRLMPSAAASSTRFTDTEAAGPEPQQALGSLQVVPVWNPGSLRCHSSRPLPGELCMGGHAAC